VRTQERESTYKLKAVTDEKPHLLDKPDERQPHKPHLHACMLACVRTCEHANDGQEGEGEEGGRRWGAARAGGDKAGSQ